MDTCTRYWSRCAPTKLCPEACMNVRATWFLAFASLCLSSLLAFGQAEASLEVFNIDPSEFPKVSADFYAFDRFGRLYNNLTDDDITVSEEAELVPVLSLFCPEKSIPVEISSVLSIDISNSMALKAGSSESTRLEVVKEAASIWVQEMRLNPSTCAITSFNNKSYINQGLTDNRAELLGAIRSLRSTNGTDYNEAFVGWPGGGLTVARNGSNKRVLVFLTDGEGEADAGAILNYAKTHEIEVYCIAVGMPAPQILRDLARETGGLYFEYVEEPEKIKAIYKVILQRIEGTAPCRLEWLSNGDCIDSTRLNRIVSFGIPDLLVKDVGVYTPPEEPLKTLELSPAVLRYGLIAPGRTETLPFTVTAINGTTTIESIVRSNPLFTVVESESKPDFFPLVLAEGRSLELTIRFAPTTPSFTIGELTFNTDGCYAPTIYCSGGARNGGGNRPTLDLLHPNGDEEFGVGIDTVITWKGILPTDPVRLEYSFDSGRSWSLIADRVTGLQYPWKVPATPSSLCLARVTQLNATDPLLVLRHGNPVVDARFMPDRKHVLTLTSNALLSLWEVSTGEIQYTLGGASSGTQLAVSPDGKWVAVGNHAERSILLWDLEDQMLLRRIPNAYFGRRSDKDGWRIPLCFSPDSRSLLTARTNIQGESLLQLIDVPSGSIQQEMKDERSFYRYGLFSPDGKHFIVGGDDGIVQLWDPTLTTLISERLIPGGDVSLISFSWDGTSFITVSESNGEQRISRWGLVGSSEEVIVSNTETTFDLDYASSDGSLLMTDGEPMLRELFTGGVVRGFSGHTDRVNATRYSSDGSLMITASDDYTARIWIPNSQEKPVDLSDSLWAIVAPEVESYNVDFGEVLLQQTKDSVLTEYIRNSGSIPTQVLGLNIVGAHRNDFHVVSGNTTFELRPADVWTIELGFKPTVEGERIARVQIITQADTLYQELRGVGLRSKLQTVGLFGDYIDFGQVPITGRRDSIAIGSNVGTTPLLIDSVVMMGPELQQFVLTDNPSPLTLNPGESIKVGVAFVPSRVGITNGRIGLYFNQAGSPAVVGLLGEGIQANTPAIRTLSELVFARQLCTPRSDTLMLPIWSSGDVPLTISDIVLEGASEFVLEQLSLPLRIRPDDSVYLSLIFTPVTPGETNATLRIKSDAGNNPDLLLPLSGKLDDVRLQLSHDTIDLGTLCPGEERSLEVVVNNVGTITTTIEESLVLSGLNGSRLWVDNGIGSLGSDSSKTALFSFSAGMDSGEFSTTITFHDSICRTQPSTIVLGRVAYPEVSIDSVPEICAGESLELQARGADRYVWFSSGDLSCQDCPNPVVTPLKTTTYYVSGYSEGDCRSIDSVVVAVREDPVELIAKIARGYRVKPGDTVIMRAQLQTLPPDWSEITSLKLKLEYNPTVMYLDTASFRTLLSGGLLDGWELTFEMYEPGLIHLQFTAPSGSSLEGVGDLLRFQSGVYLANNVGTEVAWSLTGSDDCLLFTTDNGYVGVDSICGLNYRLFEVGANKYNLSNPFPNPAVGAELTIDFSLGLDGYTSLKIVDLRGTEITLVEGGLDAGAYTAQINTSLLKSGEYFIQLQSGDWSDLRRVHILK